MKCVSRVHLLCIVVALAMLLIQGSADAFAANVQQARFRCGYWRSVASPNVGTSTNFLNGVAAVSANNVWAVGSYGNGNGGITLVEHWDGTQWKVVASPDVNGSPSEELLGVAAISRNNIWAVGDYYTASNIQQSLIEHWDGTSWSVVSSPNVASMFNVLTAVSAISATDMWAVGNYSGTQGYQALIEHWNGTNWSIVPGPSSQSGRLNGVTAIASNNVWAVGTGTGATGDQTLVEHWDGTSWSVVNSSGPGVATNTLNGVAAISANNVWAVGEDSNSAAPSATYTPLIEHWNGTSWGMVSSPLQGTSDLLNGIAAVSASDMWAVGDYRTGIDPMGPYFSLIEHWNGTAWSAVNSPSPGSLANDLVSVVRVPGRRGVWAVGFSQNDNTSQTLTAFHC